MSSPEFDIHLYRSIGEISAQDWDQCANPEGGIARDPFTSWRFLNALEESGSVGQGPGWLPQHLAALHKGQIIGVMPLYLKTHSQGEYIFDFNWADAYMRAGGAYYPKLQSAVPFTPVTGARFLVKPDFAGLGHLALLQGAAELTAQQAYSSLHITFCTEEEWLKGGSYGLLQRKTQQFHWYNEGYADFSEFLAALSSRKRKNIRKEREKAQAFGGEIRRLTGDEIKPPHWDAFWAFYQDTGARKWGSPYLTRDFFESIHRDMRNDILLVMAFDGNKPIAGALNFIGREALYGRYWGSIEHFDALHFELCYYQAIDYAIENKLSRVEAGAQGEHKLARGYRPCPTYSLHLIADPNFREAIKRYLEQEREMVNEDIDTLSELAPFKKG